MMMPMMDEKQQDFMRRFMADKRMMKEFPDNKQRAAMGMKQFKSGPPGDKRAKKFIGGFMEKRKAKGGAMSGGMGMPGKGMM